MPKPNDEGLVLLTLVHSMSFWKSLVVKLLRRLGMNMC